MEGPNGINSDGYRNNRANDSIDNSSQSLNQVMHDIFHFVGLCPDSAAHPTIATILAQASESWHLLKTFVIMKFKIAKVFFKIVFFLLLGGLIFLAVSSAYSQSFSSYVLEQRKLYGDTLTSKIDSNDRTKVQGPRPGSKRSNTAGRSSSSVHVGTKR